MSIHSSLPASLSLFSLKCPFKSQTSHPKHGHGKLNASARLPELDSKSWSGIAAAPARLKRVTKKLLGNERLCGTIG